MIRSATTSHSAAAGSRTGTQSRLVPALFAVGFGLFLFIGTGFAAPSLIHNATHDTRHSLGLPCH